MASVVPSVASTKETTNYSRLCRLLVDICSQALRDIFDGIHAPANLHTVLASHSVHRTLQALFKGKKRFLNSAQWCKLYPAIASSVSSATFDITLLMVLLRNVCNLKPPVTGWGNLPSEDDKTLEADIVRIKYFRNTVYALAAQASVNDATFNAHWQKIRAVLVRLGGAKYGGAIDILKTECMDPDIEEHYKELLQQWKKDEYVIKEQLHEMGQDLKYIKEALRVALNKHGEEANHAVVTQSGTVLLPSEVLPDINEYHSTSSSRTETPVYGSASDARYANLQDISGYFGHTFIPTESDTRISTKESARRHDYRDVKYGQAGTSSSEPMEVEQRENSRVSPNDVTSLHNVMAEGTYGKTPVQSRVRDLNTTLKHQLTIESNACLAGEESKQVSSMSSQHRRQFDSERVGGAQSTESRAGTAGGAHPVRLLYSTTSESRSSVADLKDHSTAKTAPKGSSPGPSQRTSAHQTPGTSSDNDPRNEISRERGLLEKDTKAAVICGQCGLHGTIICRNCMQIICKVCEKVYAADLCETTKGQHTFVKLTDDKTSQKASGDSKAYSSQESGNKNEACGVGDTDWSCSRCTLLNPSKHRTCVVCGATRGIGDVEKAKPGRLLTRK